jgi:hypothetical protein
MAEAGNTERIVILDSRVRGNDKAEHDPPAADASAQDNIKTAKFQTFCASDLCVVRLLNFEAMVYYALQSS